MCRAFVASLAGGLVEPDKYENNPQVLSAKEAATYMIDKKKIAVLTGAGISAASGIPTFRGEDGFWKKRTTYAGEEDPKEILTKTFFA